MDQRWVREDALFQVLAVSSLLANGRHPPKAFVLSLGSEIDQFPMPTQLAELPAEVLALVLPPSNSHLVIRLWKAGNCVLNAKLASAIAGIELRPIPGVEPKIPRMLHDLRNLRSIRLFSSKNFVSNPKNWLNVLQALPKGLESLDFDSADADSCFTNYSPESTANKLSSAELRQHRRDSSILIHGLFPRLTTLKIKCPTNPIPNLLIPTLPPTLTSLSLTCGFVYLLEVLHSMPSTLIDISTSFRADSTRADFESDSPPGFATLPPPSERPSVGFVECVAVGDCSSLSKEVVNNAIWPTLLPQGLQRVSFEFGGPPLTPTFVAKLPCSLTELLLGSMHFNTWEEYFAQSLLPNSTISIWPSNLTSLGIRPRSIHKGVLQALPRALRSLKIILAEKTNETMFFANELPPGLTSLEISLTHLHTVIGDFPASLTRWYAYGEHGIDCKSLTKLPPSVKDMTLIYDNFEEYASYQLPCHVEKLYMEVWKQSIASFSPNGLTSLTISRCMNLVFQQPFAFLPSSLTKLAINWTPRDTPLPVDCLTPLPHLVELDLCQRFDMPSTALKHNPSRDSMQRLSVKLAIVNEDDLAFLPPNLIVCNLIDFRDYDHPQIFKYWPKRAVWNIPDNLREKFVDRLRLALQDY